MQSNRQLITVVTFLCSLFMSVPVSAQIEEIIVTAQKREQNLQEVPISISALTSDQFDMFNVCARG